MPAAKGSIMKLSLRFSRPLAAAILALSVSAASAASHHQQKWVAGEVTVIDAGARSLQLQGAGKQENIKVIWDDRTKGFSSEKDQAHTFEKETLPLIKAGSHIRIRCVQHGETLVARHVVLADLEADANAPKGASK